MSGSAVNMARKQQQGVALITALLVVALAVTAAVGMVLRGQADIRRSSAVFERDLSRHIALGAEKMVLQILEQADGPDDLLWDTCLSRVAMSRNRPISPVWWIAWHRTVA